MNALVRNILKSNVKTHQNMQKSACDLIERLDNDREWSWIWIDLQVQLWSTTDQLTTSQLDRSDEWWAIMGVTQ